MILTRRSATLSLAGFSLSASMQAQAWPAKPLTIVVPYALEPKKMAANDVRLFIKAEIGKWGRLAKAAGVEKE